MSGHILVIDQGTTSTRAIAFDARVGAAASPSRELPQICPEDFTASARLRAVVRVDGDRAVSDGTKQFLADILGAPADRPTDTATKALGAAFLAGWRAGLYPGPDGFAAFGASTPGSNPR